MALSNFQAVNEFSERFNSDLKDLIYLLKSDMNGIFLVSANTKYVKSILCNCIELEGLRIAESRVEELAHYGGLRNYLRTLAADDDINKEVLFIDFMKAHVENEISDINLVDEINMNRDLYNKRISKVILIVNLKIASLIMTRAIDFWSCITRYIDFTNWYCNPVSLPLFSIDFSSIISDNLLSSYETNRESYMRFIKIRTTLEGIESFDVNLFDSIWKEINNLQDDIQYSVAVVLYANKVISVFEETGQHTDRKHIIESLEIHRGHPLLIPQVSCAKGSYYCRCGDIKEAIQQYTSAYKILVSSMKYTSIKSEIRFLKCNILVCEAILKETDMWGVYSEIEQGLSEDLNSDIVNRRVWAKAYLMMFQTLYLTQHYFEHQNMLETLTELSREPFIEDSLEAVCMWEAFLVLDGISDKPFKNKSTSDDLLNVHINICKSIYYFNIGDYQASKSCLSEAMDMAEKGDYFLLMKVVRCFDRNMEFLYKMDIELLEEVEKIRESKKTDTSNQNTMGYL